MSKIICHDYYGNVVTSLTQWDTNRVLKIHNWQYDVSPIIQWTNRSETESYQVESILNQDGTVTFEVPNAILQKPETAIAFIGVARNGENGSLDIENATVFKIEFPIQRRTKPSGYVYSDNATVVDIVALKEVLEKQIESYDKKVEQLGNQYQSVINGIDAKIDSAKTDLSTEITSQYQSVINGIDAKIDSAKTDLSTEITSALHTTLDSLKGGAPKATFETEEDLLGKESGLYLYHPPLGSTDPYDGYVFYWDGEKLSEPLMLYSGKDSQANISVMVVKSSTGQQFLEITVTDKDGNENVIRTDNLNGKDGKIGKDGVSGVTYDIISPDDTQNSLQTVLNKYIQDFDWIYTSKEHKLYLTANQNGTYSYNWLSSQSFELNKGDSLSVVVDVTIDVDSFLIDTITFEKIESVKVDYDNLTNQPIKNLALSLTEYTMLTDIADGCYIVAETGYIQTTGGKLMNFAVGTELMIATYDGVKSGTYQTGKAVELFNDNMTAGEKSFTWLNTGNKDLQITENATDDTIPTSKAVKDYVDNNSGNNHSPEVVDSIFKHKYSTDEQVVGTWIDGKPLYEKTMIIDMYDTGTIDSNSFMIPLNINDVELCLLTEQYWIDKVGSNAIFPLYQNANDSIMFYFDIANNSLRVQMYPRFNAPPDRNLRVFIFVIHYTKTTDAIPQDVTE